MLAPVLLALLRAVPLALSASWLTWLQLPPLLAGAWVLRARVVAGRDGVQVCNGLAVHRYAWDDVAGLDVPRRGPVVLLQGDRRRPMTALGRHDVRRFVAAGKQGAAVAT